MFFKEYFKSIADIIEAKYNGHKTLNQNNADKGELCEIFIKDFLQETLGDSFKISRGGKVIDYTGNFSKQLDVILTAKKSLKLFYDKGIYPTESVFGVISVTSTLSKAKLLDCCQEFLAIPKQKYKFSMDGYFSEEFVKETEVAWLNLFPFKIVFAYAGEIKEEWINDIVEMNKESFNIVNTLPDLIIVNKVGFIEKGLSQNPQGGLSATLNFVPFRPSYDNYGIPFSKMLFHLNNLTHEEVILKPSLEAYFNQDI